MSNNYEKQFKESMNRLHFSSDDKDKMYQKLMESIQASIEREEQYMKKWSLSKVAAVAAACLMITGVTALAASKITMIESNSRSGYDYNTIAEITSAQSNIKDKHDKVMPAFPETIGKGYSFDGGNITHERGKDDNGNIIDTWDNLDGVYKNDVGNTIYLSMSYKSLYNDEKTVSDTEVRDINGINVSYNYEEYLFLPDEEDEKEPDPDIKARLDSDDHFHISYGSDKPETRYFSTVSFAKEGINISIYSYDDVTSDELFSIAEELIMR